MVTHCYAYGCVRVCSSGLKQQMAHTFLDALLAAERADFVPETLLLVRLLAAGLAGARRFGACKRGHFSGRVFFTTVLCVNLYERDVFL